MWKATTYECEALLPNYFVDLSPPFACERLQRKRVVFKEWAALVSVSEDCLLSFTASLVPHYWILFSKSCADVRAIWPFERYPASPLWHLSTIHAAINKRISRSSLSDCTWPKMTPGTPDDMYQVYCSTYGWGIPALKNSSACSETSGRCPNIISFIQTNKITRQCIRQWYTDTIQLSPQLPCTFI